MLTGAAISIEFFNLHAFWDVCVGPVGFRLILPKWSYPGPAFVYEGPFSAKSIIEYVQDTMVRISLIGFSIHGENDTRIDNLTHVLLKHCLRIFQGVPRRGAKTASHPATLLS